MGSRHYYRLGIMFPLHFIAMYILMYAMVSNLSSNTFNSLNQFYMAGLMTASMGAIEMALMGSMYPKKKWNAAIVTASLIALVGFSTLIRQQTAIQDTQFIRSMIPHHDGAILMCRQATIRDPELIGVCREITSSQQREIDQMKGILDRLSRK